MDRVYCTRLNNYVNLIRNYGDNFICSWKKAGSDYKETLDLCYKKAVTATVGSMQ